MIKYLEENEKSLTKSLYKEAFFEDSQSFVDYYYDEKLKDNRILADIEGREIRSMLMLNPYNISVFDRKYKLNYIVAVATGERFKRQGFMRKLLNKALIDMNTLNIPFTYLIPANKDYYIPFDFAFVANKNEYNIDLSQTEYEKITLKELTDEEAQEIISFINEEVSQNNDVYTCRDIKYFKREIKEIASENGFINIYRDGGIIVGYESFWGANEELKERIVSKNILKREFGKENIMVRITDIKELLSSFTSKEELDIIIKINDKIIENQNRYYKVQMNDKFCTVKEMGEEEEKHAFIEFDIADFTQWIFGYNDEASCIYNNFYNENFIKNKLKSINRISGIFINEYV